MFHLIKYFIVFAFGAVLIATPKVFSAHDCRNLFQTNTLYTHLLKVTDNLPAPDLQKYDQAQVHFLEKLYHKKNLLISIAQPSKLRAIVSSENNKFQFENKWANHQSNGNSSSEARLTTEAIRLGMSVEQYHKTPASERPVYGYLQINSKEEQITGYQKIPKQYGDDIWILKQKDQNFSITIGDSFNENINSRKSLMDSKKLLLAHSEGVSIQVKKDHNFGSEQSTYSNRFLPFNQKTIQHLIQQRLENQNANTHVNYSAPLSTSKINENYYEIQIFGFPVLSDVSQFVFTQFPPDGLFLKTLQDHNIEILDWRDSKNAPKKWKPEPAEFEASYFLKTLLLKNSKELNDLNLTSEQISKIILSWPSGYFFNEQILEKLMQLPKSEYLFLQLLSESVRRKDLEFKNKIDAFMASQPLFNNLLFINQIIEWALKADPNFFPNRYLNANYQAWSKSSYLFSIYSKMTAGTRFDLAYTHLIIKILNDHPELDFKLILTQLQLTQDQSSVALFSQNLLPLYLNKSVADSLIALEIIFAKKNMIDPSLIATLIKVIMQNRNQNSQLKSFIYKMMETPNYFYIHNFFEFLKEEDFLTFNPLIENIAAQADLSDLPPLIEFLNQHPTDPLFDKARLILKQRKQL